MLHSLLMKVRAPDLRIVLIGVILKILYYKNVRIFGQGNPHEGIDLHKMADLIRQCLREKIGYENHLRIQKSKKISAQSQISTVSGVSAMSPVSAMSAVSASTDSAISETYGIDDIPKAGYLNNSGHTH